MIGPDEVDEENWEPDTGVMKKRELSAGGEKCFEWKSM